MTKYLALLLALSACTSRGIEVDDSGSPPDLGHDDFGPGDPDLGHGACAFPDYQPCSAGFFCATTCQQTPYPVEPVGTCTVIPASCPALYDPVCGCDGRTYTNECDANSASVSVAAQGACPQKYCAGLAGLLCMADEYCSFTAAANCGGDDSSGICKPRPQACPDDEPVCGCDGKTYSNECVANMNGYSVRSMGACPPP